VSRRAGLDFVFSEVRSSKFEVRSSKFDIGAAANTRGIVQHVEVTVR